MDLFPMYTLKSFYIKVEGLIWFDLILHVSPERFEVLILGGVKTTSVQVTQYRTTGHFTSLTAPAPGVPLGYYLVLCRDKGTAPFLVRAERASVPQTLWKAPQKNCGYNKSKVLLILICSLEEIGTNKKLSAAHYLRLKLSVYLLLNDKHCQVPFLSMPSLFCLPSLLCPFAPPPPLSLVWVDLLIANMIELYV